MIKRKDNTRKNYAKKGEQYYKVISHFEGSLQTSVSAYVRKRACKFRSKTIVKLFAGK